MTAATPPAQDLEGARPALDLTICDREPIHIPGTIQPHGVLFVLSASDLRISAVSANVAEHCGLEPGAMLGRPLGEFIAIGRGPSEGLGRLGLCSAAQRRMAWRVFSIVACSMLTISPASLRAFTFTGLCEMRSSTVVRGASGLR